MIILRGPQGSGKSTFVRNAGLEGHHLSLDKVREVFSGDTIGINGYMTISQQNEGEVYKFAMESLERRMKDGELIVYEATSPTRSEVISHAERAKSHGYDVLVVDFYGMPQETVIRGNNSRPERQRVPEYAFKRTYEVYQDVSGDYNTIFINSADERREAITKVEEFIGKSQEIFNLSDYKKIIHIGDLQGTLSPLIDEKSPFKDGIKPDCFYIFCGDLFDRGVENGEVGRWFVENVVDKPNVVIVAGNHEDHVEAHISGREIKSREYRDRTIPQLEAAGVTIEDLKKISEKFVPYYAYRWGQTRVLVTHGGLTRWPEKFPLIPQIILRKGVGQYGHNVDEMWVQNEASRGYIQVHGHRNSKMLPILAAENGSSKSFNLEGQVEFGGHMRFAILSNEGWETLEIRSRKFRTMPEERAISIAAGRKEFEHSMPMTAWAKEGRLKLEPLSDKVVAAFENHDMVNVKTQESMPHISSVSFSKSAFYSKNWDEYTTIARGLFIDNQDNTICARSYEKFFNHGEREETTDEALEKNVAFPVEVYDKLNGFLCITGYCERTGELIIASKSRIDGTFAEYAQQLVKDKLGAAGMEKMLRFNRDQIASLVFEAVDMKNDPHIIDYPESKLVLIGCVRRGEKFEQADYDTLVAIAKWLGVEVKEKLFGNIKAWRALSEIMKRVENNPDWRKNNPTEGVVFQDANGFQWKSKAWYYSRLKRCRSAVERIALTRRKDVPFDMSKYEDMTEFVPFLEWAQTLPDEALNLDIITLYKLFNTDKSKAEAMGKAPQPKQKDMSGYIKALNNMAKQCKDGTAKIESVRKIIETSELDNEKKALLDNFPDKETLYEYLNI